jgi:glucosylceramidase
MTNKNNMNKKDFPRSFRFIYGIISISLIMAASSCSPSKKPEVSVWSSSQDGDRITPLTGASFSENKEMDLPVIKIDTASRYQKIDGFGATFNEAGMICLNSLSEAARDSVLRNLFDPASGSGYTLMKAPITACDFASAGPWYTFDDTPGDTALAHFTIERDLGQSGMIPFIKAAAKYGKFEIESPMDFAPDWMYFAIEDGKKHIKPEYYKVLAKYYSKYIQAYAAQGIKIDYLNLFNEANNSWYSNVTYGEIGDLIKKHVAPRLRADGLSTKIQFGETANRPEGIEKFPAVLSDPDVKKNVHSLTVHGYDWDKFSTIAELHNKFPEFPIWMTEVCYVTGSHFPPGGPQKSPVFEFSDGERWGNMIMNDMKNWISGWIYWNMILDSNGGPWLISPSHGDFDPNQQHPVVIIDTDTRKITYTGLYYYLAHFSRFIRPGAYRVNTSGGTEKLNFAGFQNTDGSIVLNVINNGDETSCKVMWKGKMIVQKFKAHSITTLKWN